MPIRPAAPGDAPAILSLILSIQRDEFGLSIDAADQPDLADIDGFYRQGAGDFWVAQAGARIVGTIALKDFAPAMGALRKMFVAPEHRGASAGVAAALLDQLLRHSRTAGLESLWLGTADRLHAAHRFYEKQGFTAVEADALPAGFPRMAVDNRFYRRRLD